MAVYSLGLPFLATSLFSDRVLSFFRKRGRLFGYFNAVVSLLLLLLLLGILVFTQNLGQLANFGLLNYLLLN